MLSFDRRPPGTRIAPPCRRSASTFLDRWWSSGGHRIVTVNLGLLEPKHADTDPFYESNSSSAGFFYWAVT